MINVLSLNFVWNGKPNIRKNIVIKDYTEGGLKMFDLFAFVTPLSCAWIRRIVHGNGKWKNIVYTMIFKKYTTVAIIILKT